MQQARVPTRRSTCWRPGPGSTTTALAVVSCLSWGWAGLLHAQQPPLATLVPGPLHDSQDRVAALLAEAERLAQESRTLLGDLRKLEVERDLQNERARQAAAAVAGASRTLASADARLMELEAERDAQIPELRTRLLDLYKRGRSGNVRLILGATSVRDFARTTRAVAAMARVTKTRLDEHRRLLTSAQQERAIKAEALGRLQSERRKVEQGRAAAAAAIQATTKLLAEIDGRRDLAAQLAGELQVAAKKLEEQIAAVATPPVAPSSPSSITSSTAPGFALRMPVRGGLEWPLNGPVVGRFGEASNRTGGTAPRNGIEIEAGEGAPARAIHAGSVVFASPFPGFGTLVILDHSFGYHSVYGYLDSTALRMGDTVEVGHEVGRVGTAPGRPLALYFELRLDGRSVDPVQWLRLR